MTSREPCGKLCHRWVFKILCLQMVKKKNQARCSTDLERFSFYFGASQLRHRFEATYQAPHFFIARQEKMATRTRFCVSCNYFRLVLKGLNGEGGTARGLEACLQDLLAQPSGTNHKSWFPCALFSANNQAHGKILQRFNHCALDDTALKSRTKTSINSFKKSNP